MTKRTFMMMGRTKDCMGSGGDNIRSLWRRLIGFCHDVEHVRDAGVALLLPIGILILYSHLLTRIVRGVEMMVA